MSPPAPRWGCTNIAEDGGSEIGDGENEKKTGTPSSSSKRRPLLLCQAVYYILTKSDHGLAKPKARSPVIPFNPFAEGFLLAMRDPGIHEVSRSFNIPASFIACLVFIDKY
jgi:hypothetical protein